MQQFQLKYRDSSLTYYRFGQGAELVLCFHGYGETGKAFSFLEKAAADRYSFIALDLPYHGETEWREGLEFTTNDLLTIIQLIKKETGRADDRAILLGFSLGGRLALQLYEISPQTVNRIVLLAPDGLKVNPWYWFATQTILGDRLFALTMRKPGWFLWILKLANSLRLLNSSIYKFVNYYIGDARVRDLLYKRWITLRKMKPSLPGIRKSLKSSAIPLRLVYGNYDKIILTQPAHRFIKGLGANSKLQVIEAGHQVLHEKHAKQILAALMD